MTESQATENHADTQMTSTGRAIAAWRTVLGERKVSADNEAIDAYARTTQASAPRPCCVLYPESTSEVQEIVKVAGREGVVVYPISCGKNWGYGDACAPTTGAAIIDLGKMKKIIEVNRELAYCVIEPGVTQGELYDHLQHTKSGLWMDASAAGPDSSLVGNTADRGFGHTRYGDHLLTCSGMEIVLADGQVLNTGFGHFENAKSTHVYPYGVGPFMDGLFTQSNYGIITKIGLWLMPEPEAFNFFYFQAPEFEDIARLVDRLRPLRMNGTLDTAIHIGNDFRVLAGGGVYPWEDTGGKAPLPQDVRIRLRKRRGAQAWQGSGSITGTAGHVRATRKALRKALRGVSRPKFVTDRTLNFAEKAIDFLNYFGIAKETRARLRIVRPNFDLLKGIPTEEPVQGSQWRLRNPPAGPVDPLTVGTGLYWVSPVMPMQGEHALKVLGIAEPIFAKHGFDMVVSLILLTERSVVAIFNVAFDKSVEGENEAGSACYEELVDALLDSGYVIYRSGLQGMPKLHRGQDVYWDVARRIKEALDPDDIISRGRYIPPLKG